MSDLCLRSSRRDGWSLRDPDSAQPRPRRRRCPPVTTARRGPGGAPASPPHPGKSARASGCPAPGARDPHPPARAPPPARRSPPARPLPRQAAPAPGGEEEQRTGYRKRVPTAAAGRRAGPARPIPPPSRQPGASWASQVPAGGAWAGQPPKPSGPGGVETGNPRLGGFPKY